MKLNSTKSLLTLTVILLLTAIVLFWIQIQNSDLESDSKSVNSSQSQTINLDQTTDLRLNSTHSNDANNQSNTQPTGRKTSFVKHDPNNHSTESVSGFSDIITDPVAIEKLREITNRSHEGIEIETLPSGQKRIDLKNRWSTVHVSYVDENGVVRTGEWAPAAEK